MVTVRDRDDGRTRGNSGLYKKNKGKCAAKPHGDPDVHITSGSIIQSFVFGAGAAVVLRDLASQIVTAIVIASAMEPAIHFYRAESTGYSRLFCVSVCSAVFLSVLFILCRRSSAAANFLPCCRRFRLSIFQATHGVLPWGNVGDQISSADLLRNISNTLADTTGGYLPPFRHSSAG